MHMSEIDCPSDVFNPVSANSNVQDTESREGERCLFQPFFAVFCASSILYTVFSIRASPREWEKGPYSWSGIQNSEKWMREAEKGSSKGLCSLVRSVRLDIAVHK